VGDEASLAERLIALLNDEAERSRRGEAAARVVQENRGAVARVVDWVGQVASG